MTSEQMALTDALYMTRALQLAAEGVGFASPNPLCGCVVVHSGQTVGEGTWTLAGSPVASALQVAGGKALGGTAYLNRLPRTGLKEAGSTADLLRSAGVARVVIAKAGSPTHDDSQEYAALEMLGVQLTKGILEIQDAALNRAYEMFSKIGRPYVTLASTHAVDNAQLRARQGMMRHSHDAMLTDLSALAAMGHTYSDTSGLPRRRPPMRFLLDPDLAVPAECDLVASWNDDLIILSESTDSALIEAIEGFGIAVESMNPVSQLCCWKDVLAMMVELKLLSLLVEASPATGATLLDAGLVDEVHCFHPTHLPFVPAEWTASLASLNPRTAPIPGADAGFVTIYRIIHA